MAKCADVVMLSSDAAQNMADSIGNCTELSIKSPIFMSTECTLIIAHSVHEKIKHIRYT